MNILNNQTVLNPKSIVNYRLIKEGYLDSWYIYAYKDEDGNLLHFVKDDEGNFSIYQFPSNKKTRNHIESTPLIGSGFMSLEDAKTFVQEQFGNIKLIYEDQNKDIDVVKNTDDNELPSKMSVCETEMRKFITKEYVRKTKWIISEFSDYVYWIPDEAKIGDVAFVTEQERPSVFEECIITAIRDVKDFPESDIEKYYEVRSEFSEPHDYIAEFFVDKNDRDTENFVVALKTVQVNPVVNIKDFNVIHEC